MNPLPRAAPRALPLPPAAPPTLTYQWQRFNGSTWTNLSNGGGISGATTLTLSLADVSASDAGDFRVRVSNSFGSVTSTAAILTVTANQAPSATITIDSGLTGGKFVAGQEIAFSATAIRPGGWPPQRHGVHLARRLHHHDRFR